MMPSCLNDDGVCGMAPLTLKLRVMEFNTIVYILSRAPKLNVFLAIETNMKSIILPSLRGWVNVLMTYFHIIIKGGGGVRH